MAAPRTLRTRRTFRQALIGLAALISLASGCRDVSTPAMPTAPAPAPPAPEPPSLPDPDIYVATVDGAVAAPLTRGFGPVWAPDGRSIAFYRRDWWVYAVGVDGSGLRRLAPGHGPSWSPDGRRIAFNGPEGINVMNADGSGLGTLVRHDFAGSQYPVVDQAVGGVAWSPDGARLAFTLYDVDHGWALGLFVANADGSGVQLVSPDADDPSWSPDGVHLAFRKWTSAGGITVRDLRGGVPDVRFPDPLGARVLGDLAWTPDGGSLAFATFRGVPYDYDIWTMPLTGTGRLLIEHAQQPAWSPDGTHIAFVRTPTQ